MADRQKSKSRLEKKSKISSVDLSVPLTPVSNLKAQFDDLLSMQNTPIGASKKRKASSSPDLTSLNDDKMTPPAKSFTPDPAMAAYVNSLVDTKVQSSLQPYLDLIKKQEAAIQAKDITIQAQDVEINDLKVQLAAAKSTVPSKDPDDFSTPTARTMRILQSLDHHEQYSRRNTLRLTGVKVKLNTGQNTDDLVIDIARKVGVTLDISDIDRSHWNSPDDQNKGRELIVKFVRHRERTEFISQRAKLRATDDKYSSIYINEDLTKIRYSLLREMINAKKKGKLFSVWTYDGTLWYKRDDKGKPIKVKNPISFDPDTLSSAK